MIGLENSNFSLFFDLINYLIILFLIYIFFYKQIINKFSFYALAIFCATPFFGNDVLFSLNIFPDQSKYINNVIHARENFFNFLLDFYNGEIDKIKISFLNLNHDQFPKIIGTSIFISLIPLPFIETTQSLAFFCKFIFLIWFVFIITNYTNKRKKLDYRLLFLIFPSVLLFSSVALKDLYILVFFHLSLYSIFIKKYYLFPISLLLIGVLRVELLPIVLIISVSYIYFYSKTFNKFIKSTLYYEAIKLIIFLIIISFSLYFILNIINLELLIENINNRRIGYYYEGDLNNELELLSFNFDQQISFLVRKIIFAIFTPLFSKSDSMFLEIFIIENLAILILFVYMLIKIFKISFSLGVFYTFAYIIINLTVGSVVINDFAIYRYKVTLLLALVLIMFDELNRSKKNENTLFYKS